MQLSAHNGSRLKSNVIRRNYGAGFALVFCLFPAGLDSQFVCVLLFYICLCIFLTVASLVSKLYSTEGFCQRSANFFIFISQSRIDFTRILPYSSQEKIKSKNVPRTNKILKILGGQPRIYILPVNKGISKSICDYRLKVH